MSASQETPAVPPLLRDLLRPYRRSLAIILAATLVSMVMSLAAPWPLKVILDNVVANHRPPSWIVFLFPMVGGTTKTHIAAAAGIATVAIAVVTGALTLVTMIVVMFLLRWDFALIALAVTPVLIIFLIRVNKSIKTAVTE